MAPSPTTSNLSPSAARPSIPPHTIHDIKQNTSLWYRLHVFTYDLRNFQEKVDSKTRLETIVDASYLGLPYFRDEEVEYLKSTLIHDGDGDGSGMTLQQKIQEVLDERLERRMKKRVESEDYRVCAAHDLAPIFEYAFDVRAKDLATNLRFQELVTTYGLNLKDDEEFVGLGKSKSKSLPKNKKGKKGRKE